MLSSAGKAARGKRGRKDVSAAAAAGAAARARPDRASGSPGGESAATDFSGRPLEAAPAAKPAPEPDIFTLLLDAAVGAAAAGSLTPELVGSFASLLDTLPPTEQAGKVGACILGGKEGCEGLCVGRAGCGSDPSLFTRVPAGAPAAPAAVRRWHESRRCADAHGPRPGP